jgi:probable rRNA maturation factor
MEINILIEEGLKVALEIDWLQNILEKVLIAEKSPSNAEISLVITSQERIRELNREYRGKDRPTDVLSFSMAEEKIEEEPAGFIVPPDGLIHLGEVIISYPQAVIQASERRHSLKNEMAILITHGVLHILGYDHEKPEMEPTMQARETEILGSIQKEIL